MRAALALIIFFLAISTAAYADNHTQPQTDPCAGVTCSSPPAAECDGSNVKTYSGGSCSNGQCSYSSSTSSCRFGCSLGQCKPCEPSACGTNTKTCPDGFVAACQQTCAGDSCAACEPSCAGHETPTTAPPPSNGTSGGTSGSPTPTPVCPTQPPAPSCPSNSQLKSKFDNSCLVGYECVPFTNGTGTACPPSPGQPGCPAGWRAKMVTDASGCIVKYECKAAPSACPPAPSPPACEPRAGFYVKFETMHDSNGCVAGYECKYEPTGTGGALGCPPGCECKTDEHGGITTFCPSERRCNFNNVCDKDEDSSCRDCIGAGCPLNRQCGDGSSVPCKRTEGGCQCEPCQLQSVPPGCRQISESGFIRVVCEQRQCPPVPQGVRIRCVDEGGTPIFSKNGGCEVFQCDFGGKRSSGTVFATPQSCPSPEAVIQSLEKCRDLGLPGVIGFEGGCKIGKCIQQQEKRCTEVSRKAAEQECFPKRMDVAPYYQDGCPAYRCVERRGDRGRDVSGHGCEQDLPREAYERCSSEGGQLVVRRDQGGCVSYSNCIRRGNAEESFVHDIDEIPDTTELLSIAFKLEDLKLEFDKLAKKTNDIAEYYKSTGSSEEKRFRRVSGMFTAAKDKVDEVKTKLRERARDIEKDDVLEIKQDLRYLKDVVLKDILFVMLGSGEEIEEIKSGATKDCGTDESCFDRAFRVCQPLRFRPEGREGPVVEVTGLEGDACVMHVSMENGPPAGAIPGINPPYEMTCKITKYSLGVSNPETDVFPFCTGNMVELIKQFGTDGRGGPGVPGKCSGEQCQEYCGRGPAEAKECLEHLGRFLPNEAKQYLTALAEGRSPGGFGGGFGPGDREFEKGGEFRGEFRGEFGEGEFRGGFERGEFRNEFGGEFQQGGQPQGGLCPDGQCDEFEQRTGACPQDCGGSFGGGSSGLSSGQSSSSGGGAGGCSGCLNNGICDQGECSDCADCRRG